jgi:hypothetical protein
MVDTPELFGGELRILAAIDFRDGKIVRWVDYWDAGPYDDELYGKLRTPDAHFPRDLKDAEVPTPTSSSRRSRQSTTHASCRRRAGQRSWSRP